MVIQQEYMIYIHMAEYRLIMADKTKQLYDESTPLYIGGYNKNVSDIKQLRE